MCGIAGVWGAVDEACVSAMLDKLAHRGPDGRGMHSFPGDGTIGAVRLAIMDPAGGAQPLFNEARDLALVANGEIYNYPALRAGLESRHQFDTGSDSEVILHTFEDRDTAGFARLDGMFAVAIARAGRLVLARDPIGIKPLYYSWNGKTGDKLRLRFASEIKALMDSPDPVKPLPPGGIFDSERGLSSYYSLPLPDLLSEPADEIAERLGRVMRESVQRHLMSDVPVGALVSGGLDSGIVAALARPHLKDMHTFTVGTEGSEDLEKGRLVAQTLGTIHHEYVFTVEEIVEEMPAIARHLESYDQFMVTNAIPNWFCSRLASQHVKVVLCGEGADEMFAGYRYFTRYTELDMLRRELHRNTADLHSTNLQRVDRMAMAHGVECRVPYINPAVAELALAIPPELKLGDGPGGRRYEKWILRRAFTGLLPDDIIWGTKRNFDEGTGLMTILDQAVTAKAGPMEFGRYRKRHAARWLKRREEIVFHKLVTEQLGDSPALHDNVARWRLLRLLDPNEEPPKPIAVRPWWKFWG